MDKQNVVYLTMKYCSAKKGSTDTCYNVNKPQKHYTKSKTTDIKDHKWYDSYMECLQYANQ